MSIDYIGRFAPSPTGKLHIGSLLAAVASFLDARAHNGQWLVRMEDLDPLREVAGAADDILRTLDAFSLHWDQDIIYQSSRHHVYRTALEMLQAKNLIYPCFCSRKTLHETCKTGIDGPIYNGHCRMQKVITTEQNSNDSEKLAETSKTPAYRIRIPSQVITFDDDIIGRYTQNLDRDIGDFVLLRADGMWAYQLAVVVDDAAQGITHIVRGQDLLISTPRQIYLQQCLSYQRPHYAHLPLLTNHMGQKWSKQTHAQALDLSCKERLLHQVLIYLNLPAPIPKGNCAELLQWAIKHWDIARISASARNTESDTMIG